MQTDEQTRAMEIWREAHEAFLTTMGNWATDPRQAAASVIAAALAERGGEWLLWKAKMLAETEEKEREQAERIRQLEDVLRLLRGFDGWTGTYHAGHAYDARKKAMALLAKHEGNG